MNYTDKLATRSQHEHINRFCQAKKYVASLYGEPMMDRRFLLIPAQMMRARQVWEIVAGLRPNNGLDQLGSEQQFSPHSPITRQEEASELQQ
jgi:hypothetical protein